MGPDQIPLHGMDDNAVFVLPLEVHLSDSRIFQPPQLHMPSMSDNSGSYCL